MKKYEFTDEVTSYNGRKVHRIRALRDIPRFGVKAGDLGGYIEGEHSLSHEGDCWVGSNSIVSGDSRILDDAYVYYWVFVNDGAVICERSRVEWYATVSGTVKVSGDAYVNGADIRGNVRLSGNVRIVGKFIVSGDCEIGGNTEIAVPELFDCQD